MNKLIAPFVALAFIFSAAIAHADAAGVKVAEINESTLILDDGTTFTISEGVSTEGLEPGTDVIVSFEEKDGEKVATEVTPSN